MAKFVIILLLVALSTILAYGEVFLNIDCGSPSATDFYTDEYSKVWIGDGSLIGNGVTQLVQSSYSVSKVMDTLRVFTTRKKNCYVAKVDKGEKVLVRASFLYGNYDKKSSPPTFDLQFDGNEWTTVVTSNDQVVTYEAIYVVKGDVMSVCLAQTKSDQFPFISALEIRSLDSNMYGEFDSNYALFLKSRVAYGTDAVVRSPTDSYDRIWTPAAIEKGYVNVTSDNLLPFDVTLADNPPLNVLQNAITTAASSDNLILNTGDFDSLSVYFNMYFSEVTELDSSTQTRSFKIYIDNLSVSDEIVPPYQNVKEIVGNNITVSSNTTFSLVATSGANLPPLINAMEIFYISNQLTDGTNSDDVEVLSVLQNTFDVLQDWSGDPCLPATYTWDWLECSTDATPRVTALRLSSSTLSGSLPDLSSMTALQIIDLHNNSLVGPIPDSLGTLPNLMELNLADNQFSGNVPTSLSKNNKLKLDVTGNPTLCTSSKSCDPATSTPSSTTFPTISSSSGTGRKKKSKLPVILGTTIPSGFLVSALASFFAWVRRKRKKTSVVATGIRPHGAGQYGGGNKPNPLVEIGQAVMEEIRVNIEQQVTAEVIDVISREAQNVTANQNT